MPASSVLAIGDTTVDEFLSIKNLSDECRVDEQTKELCVKFGEKIDIDQCTLSVGGNAANVAVGMSRLGVQSGLVTELGDNALASIILHALEKENIEKTHIVQIPHTDSSLAIGISFQGDRTLFVEHVKRQNNFPFDQMQNIQLVYLTSLGHEWETPYLRAVEMAERNGAKLALNPGSIQLHEGKETLLKVLRKTYILFVNKEEGEMLINDKLPITNDQNDVRSLMRELQKLGPKMIVMTDGMNGAFALDENGKDYFLAAIPVTIVEKTGAGDAFTSGFLAAWYTGLGIEKAMEWGAKNAASVIGKVGAQEGLLTLEQIANNPITQ